MQLSDKAIDDFRAAYGAAYGEDITRDEAGVMGAEVLHFIRLLLRRHTTQPPSSSPPKS
jgi:hypothetical protein